MKNYLVSQRDLVSSDLIFFFMKKSRKFAVKILLNVKTDKLSDDNYLFEIEGLNVYKNDRQGYFGSTPLEQMLGRRYFV